MGLKLYQASYYQTYGYGAYDEYEYVTVANNEQEALGLALAEEPSTIAKHWTIIELDATAVGAHRIFTTD